jgi:hypothetical protein
MRMVGAPSCEHLAFGMVLVVLWTYVFDDLSNGGLDLLRIAHVALVVEHALLLGLFVVYLLHVQDSHVGVAHAVRLGEQAAETVDASGHDDDLLAQINLPRRAVREPVAEDVEDADCAHEQGPRDGNAHLERLPWRVLGAQAEHEHRGYERMEDGIAQHVMEQVDGDIAMPRLVGRVEVARKRHADFPELRRTHGGRAAGGVLHHLRALVGRVDASWGGANCDDG